MKRLLILFLLPLLAVPGSGAPKPGEVRLTVAETLGERRFGYPVTAHVPLPQGALQDAEHVALEQAGKPLHGTQFDIRSRWPDGSVQWLDVSLNLSPGPLAEEKLQLQYGPDTHGEPRARGVVEETPGSFTLRNTYRVPRLGPVFLDSVQYGAERLRQGAFWTVDGGSGPLALAAGGESRVVTPGPVNAVVERTGTYEGGGKHLPYRLTLAQPNSKSWIDASLHLEDPSGSVRRISVTMPYALQKSPARWDAGVGSWVYGTLRKEAQVRLEVGKGATWSIFTAPGDDPTAAYARGAGSRSRFEGWGHLIDGGAGGLAVAWGSPDWTRERSPLPGEVRITGGGDLTLTWQLSGKGPHAVRALFHHVADPVPVTAVTSPAAMLHPLRVSLPEDWARRCGVDPNGWDH